MATFKKLKKSNVGNEHENSPVVSTRLRIGLHLQEILG